MRTTRKRMLLAVGPAYRGPARRDAPNDSGNSGGTGGDGTLNGGGGSGGTVEGNGQGDKGTQDGKTPQYQGDFDKERHERALAAARDGETKAKADAKAAKDQLAAVLKAAGLTPDGKTDPAELLKSVTAERDTAAEQARQNAVELAAFRRAEKAGADAVAVLDSRGFLDKVKGLDPAAADFADKVEAAMKDAVKENPRLAAAAPTGTKKLGADHSGTGGRQRATSLGAAITAAYQQ